MWTALAGDVAPSPGEAASRQAAEDHMALLTPVIKGVLTDRGFANTVLAQQVYGGHGYIAEHGMEQFVRDARIAMLYEGANGIQALDLVGRKLAQDNGRALQAFTGELQDYIARHGEAVMQPYVGPLASALGDLREATAWLMRHAPHSPDDAGAGATDYMHLMGLVALGYMWCRIVEAAMGRLARDASAARMRDKLVTGRFFVERMLPETALHLARIRLGSANVMELPAEAF
jgi:acyl-CoA dehydrogenase